MYPHERSLVKQLKNLPFEIIGVNSDQDLEKLHEVLKKENITWRSFQNEEGVDGTISDSWAITGWPTIFILDEKGTIRWKGHGGDIDGEITKLLAEMGHEVEIVHEEEPDAESETDKNAASEGSSDSDEDETSDNNVDKEKMSTEDPNDS